MWLEDMNEYTDLTTKHNGQPEGMITKHTKPRWRYCLYKLHTILNGGVLFAMMTATVFITILRIIVTTIIITNVIIIIAIVNLTITITIATATISVHV